MKKAVLVVLVCVLLVCTSFALAQEALSVSIWGSQTRTERTEAAISLYEQNNPGVTVELRPFEWNDYWSMLDAHAAAKSLPDVLQMDYQYLNQYVDDGLLLDLSPYVDRGTLNLSDMNEDVVATGMVDGKLYAVCLGVNAPALLYNRSLLDSIGLTVPDNMTMDDFVVLSREIYEKTGYKTNIGFGTDMLLGYYLRGLGVDLFHGDTLAATFESLESFFSLYERGILEGWHLGSDVFTDASVGAVEQDPIISGTDPSGRSWCAFLWSNQMTALQEIASQQGMELGITTWPSADVKLSNYLKPSQFFSVTASSAAPQAAASFIDYFVNAVPCNEILLAERGIPASTAVSTAISPLLDSANQKVAAYMNDVVAFNCSAPPKADPAGAAEFYSLVDELVESLCSGMMTAEDAALILMAEAPALLR